MVSLTVPVVYSGLNNVYYLRLNKLINKLNILKRMNHFFFFYKKHLIEDLNIFFKLSNSQKKSKFFFCISYSKLKKCWYSLNKLYQHFFNLKKTAIISWLIDKFYFKRKFYVWFTDLIVCCFFL